MLTLSFLCLPNEVKTFLVVFGFFRDFSKGIQTNFSYFPKKSRPLSFFGVNPKFQKVTRGITLFGVTFWLHKIDHNT